MNTALGSLPDRVLHAPAGGWAGICPASKKALGDRWDTSSAKSPIETSYAKGCETSVPSVPSVPEAL